MIRTESPRHNRSAKLLPEPNPGEFLMRSLIRALAAVIAASPIAAQAADATWPSYGGDPGGQKYSSAAQITPANVKSLKPAWTFRTGDLKRRPDAIKQSAFEGTPILVGDKLVLCTPFNEVIALDPGTGEQKWRFDPQIPTDTHPANQFVCRGVTQWTDSAAADGATCRTRIFTGTNDYRLIALDADTGKPCEGFGKNGEIKIDPGMELVWPGEFQITSPPAVVRGTVIVGSSIGDNTKVEAPKGTVRAYDAISGAPRWTFDPVARTSEGKPTAGHANVWAPMSVDEAAGLVFLPTSSASPDFYGALRPGDDKYANSVVALEAQTGKIVWSFQTVHHDLWDYDVASQPTLTALDIGGARRDAVVQGTKMGLIFTLDRATGQPLIPVEERAVPQSDVPGEAASPTQPFPLRPPPLVPAPKKIEAFGFTPFDKGECRGILGGLRWEGLYTPPGLKGTALYPFTGGGINWGGVAIDPERQILVTNTNRLVHEITLIPQENLEAARKARPDTEYGRQRGAPYAMRRELVHSGLEAPCNAPPWGMIHAIDMKTGAIKWEHPLGTAEDLVPFGDLFVPKGVPNLGGPMITASGLVFIGATHDHYLRAFDLADGKELWRARLPASAHATPMTYMWKGRQYVVVSAGGYGRFPAPKLSDHVLSFALPAAK